MASFCVETTNGFKIQIKEKLMLPKRSIKKIFVESELVWVRKKFIPIGPPPSGPNFVQLGSLYKEIVLLNAPNLLGKCIGFKIIESVYIKKITYEVLEKSLWTDTKNNKAVSNYKLKNFLNSIERDYANFGW